MGTDVDRPGVWLDVPDQAVRDAFVEHMQTSAYPEHFTGIAQGVKPPFDRGFRIIKKHVYVQSKQRDEPFAPCNLCGPKPKFKNKGMLISDELGWLYLIGPDCGQRHYEGRFRDEDRRFEREQAERAAQDFLLSQLARVAAWGQNAVALRPYAEAAALAHSRLAKSGKVVQELRRAVNQHDGWLRVDEPRQTLQRDGTQRTDYFAINLVRIRGADAVKSTCNIIDKLLQAASVFDAYGLTEDSAFDYVAAGEKQKRLPEMADELRDAISLLEKVRRFIEELHVFFSVENYVAIERWAKHTHCPLQMLVECQGDIRTLEAIGAHHRFPIDVAILMKPLPLAVDD